MRFRENLVRRQGQIGIGAGLGPSDTPAQLIELPQSEHVRPVDDDGVGRRHVQAGFDDVGAEQHVELLVIERRHDIFERGDRHLAMRHTEADLRHQFPQTFLKQGDVAQARDTHKRSDRPGNARA